MLYFYVQLFSEVFVLINYEAIFPLFFETFLIVIYTKTTKPVHASQGQVAPIKCTIMHH